MQPRLRMHAARRRRQVASIHVCQPPPLSLSWALRTTAACTWMQEFRIAPLWEIVAGGIDAAVNASSTQFTASTGISVQPRSSVDGGASSSDEGLAARELAADASVYMDGYIVDAEQLPTLADVGLVAPVDPLLKLSADLQLYRISRFHRAFTALHQQQTYGIPLGGAGAVFMYRKDAFALRNLSVPNTWGEVLALAKASRGIDLNGDGVADHTFCAQRHGGEPRAVKLCALHMHAPRRRQRAP